MLLYKRLNIQIQITYKYQMIEELQKENKLYKEYIATLQKQIQANHEERNALCRTMNGLGEEIDTLNKRVSKQSLQKIREAALNHLQEKYKNQCAETDSLRKKLQDSQAKYYQLFQQSSHQERKIQQKGKQLQKAKLYTQNQQEKYSKAISLKDLSLKQKEEQIFQLQRQSKDYEQKMLTLQNFLKEKQLKIIELEKVVKTLEKRNLELYEWGQKQKKRQNEQRQTLISQISNISKQKYQMAQEMIKLEQSANALQAQNEQLDCNLKEAKLQVEQLSSQLKQYLTNKVVQKDKNKTLNPRQSQEQFNSAFSQLKVQILAIKKGGENEQYDKTNQIKLVRQSKENIAFDLNSPSKWKSIQSKLSLLRNAPSLNRLKSTQ